MTSTRLFPAEVGNVSFCFIQALKDGAETNEVREAELKDVRLGTDHILEDINKTQRKLDSAGVALTHCQNKVLAR